MDIIETILVAIATGAFIGIVLLLAGAFKENRRLEKMARDHRDRS